ncbi:MAG: MATE family efflux transporter [Prevotella sp.]|nr:MATE family efflux transporter [Prevotella sp.]
MIRFSAHNHDILRLALPSIVQNVTVPLLGLADVTIMGHIGDARHIGAIAVGSMIFNVLYWLCAFLRMGTSGITAQAYGNEEQGNGDKGRSSESHPSSLEDGRVVTELGKAKSQASSRSVLGHALGLALGIGLVMVLLQAPLRWLSFLLMQPTANVAGLCLSYYNICIWGAPAVLGLYALTGWFIGMQDTRTPMMVAILQNVLNIVASLFFVIVLDLGIEGVALGTLLAQWAGFVMALIGLRAYGVYGSYWSHEPHSPSLWGRFFSVNRDIFLRTLCLVAVNFYFTSAGAKQGALMLAVNTLLMQLFMLFSYFMDGFAYAGEALAGRYYGAQNLRALKEVIANLFKWGWAVVALFTLVYWLGGTAFLRLLTSDGDVVQASATYLPWALLIPLAGMAAFIWDGVFIGVTYTRGMLVSCFLASVVFFLLWFSLHVYWGNHALWAALIAFLAGRGILQTWLWLQKNR